MIVKSSITQQVIDYIKENIADGIWLVGEKMPSENELTKMLGVSRTSVRVAIQQFIALGILESKHGKGTFVVSNNLAGFGRGADSMDVTGYTDLHQIFEFRIIVEPEACHRAASRASEENIRQLRFLLSQMKQAFKQNNSADFVRYDMMYHEEICRASGNVFLESSLREIFRQKAESHRQVHEFFGFKDGIYYHTLILQSIEARNPKKARKAMHEHMQKALEDIDQEKKKDKPGFADEAIKF